MPYDARIIADWFLSRAWLDGRQITQMQLQKLVYIAHGWHLAITGKPLVNDSIEAWRWGPVIRSLYANFADFGSGWITPSLPPSIQISHDSLTIMEKVWEQYGGFSGPQLSAMTHAEGTPWSNSYADRSPPNTIPNESIANHYRQLAASRK